MPDGTGLVSGGGDRTVKYWDISLLGSRSQDGRMEAMESGTAKEVLTFRGHEVSRFTFDISAYANSLALVYCLLCGCLGQ
jgi:WD40 repeat protein